LSPETFQEEVIIRGVAVSPGISIAPVHVSARGMASPEVYEISSEHIDLEIGRFKLALEKTKTQLSELQTSIERISGEKEGQIFEAHLMILQDKMLVKRVTDSIKEREQNAEYVFYAYIQNYVEAMRRMNDPYLSERASDIDDICQRVIRNFSHVSEHESDTTPNHHHILVAYDLTPSDTATMDRTQVLGFATEQGSINSHTAILARSLGIPAIAGISGAVLDIISLSNCILDGIAGKLILHPTEETLKEYRQKQRAFIKQDEAEHLSSREQAKAQTSDGREIILSANIEFSHELPLLAECGAEGIGLFRTEFFLLNQGQEIPSEEEQYRVYKKAAEVSAPHLCVIRTLDAGGDKLPAEPLSEPEPNPFLGWRGIRVSLERQEIFKNQIRALLRASAHGKIGIMFPMVSGLTEIFRTKQIVADCKAELDAKGQAYDEDVQIGIMIEVPSAAIMAMEMGKHVDFFSIGTNDLVQYTVAVDRVNHQVSHLYRSTNPAVIRLIKMTVDAAKANGIWTGVCGEMAGDLTLTPLLVGLGIDELSMGNHQLPRIKQAMKTLDYDECQELAAKALTLCTSTEVLDATLAVVKNNYADLLYENRE